MITPNQSKQLFLLKQLKDSNCLDIVELLITEETREYGNDTRSLDVLKLVKELIELQA